MKKFKQVILSSLVLVSSFVTQTGRADGESREGFGAGNGGDVRAAVYARKALSIAQFMQGSALLTDEQKSEVLRRALRLKIEMVSQESLNCEGGERMACSFPILNLTQISARQWERIQANGQEVIQLIIHELLRVSEIEDAQYALSHLIRNAFVIELRSRAEVPSQIHVVISGSTWLALGGLYGSHDNLTSELNVVADNLTFSGYAAMTFSYRPSIFQRCGNRARDSAERLAIDECLRAGGLSCHVISSETFSSKRRSIIRVSVDGDVVRENNEPSENFARQNRGLFRECGATAVAIDLAEYAW